MTATLSPNTFSTGANEHQLSAILTTDGPLLIIAGPGSGKTFTLVERIVYLITVKNVTPESLFVVTFTDKAARELITRISNRLNSLDIQYIDPESHTVRSYYPDFLLQKEDGMYVIVEVKGDNMIDDPIVLAKKEFAKQIATASGMEYQTIKGSDAMNRQYRMLL